MRMGLLGVVGLGLALACGGLGGPGAPSPIYKTFETTDGRQRLVFSSGSSLSKTWRNMSGPAVAGDWSMRGDRIDVTWEDVSHIGMSSEQFVVQSECSLTRISGVTRADGERIESPTTYVLAEPRCH